MKHLRKEIDAGVAIGYAGNDVFHLIIFVGGTSLSDGQAFEVWEFGEKEVNKVVADIQAILKNEKHPTMRDVYNDAIDALYSDDVAAYMAMVVHLEKEDRK